MRLLQTVQTFLSLPLLAAIASAAPAGGYLFVTFKGEQTPLTEQIYFATSRDGREWTALNNGDPVLVSQLGEKGVRDPYLLRAHDGKNSSSSPPTSAGTATPAAPAPCAPAAAPSTSGNRPTW